MSEQLPNVRLQNLRDFTVQIRHPTTDAIVGTGVAVSNTRLVTCAHVVVAAGVDPRACDGAEVGVYFAQALGGEKKERRAAVACCFPQHDDDIVVLQLSDGLAPLAPEQFAVLGRANQSVDHGFKSFGYRRLANYQGLPAKGEIVDFANKPDDKTLHGEMLMLQSSHIDSGMSGAAVLDTERNLVVGLIAETYDSGRSFADRDTGFAVDATVLSIPPFDLPIHEDDLPLRAAPQPQTDIAAARAAVSPNLSIALNGAPASLEADWVGRDELLRAIRADWIDPQRHVTGLIGFGGEGKSSLARRWLDTLLADSAQTLPEGVFWWAFYDKPSVDEFFEAALKYLSGGKIDPRKLPSANLRAQVIGAMLGAGRYLFVLDGLEVLQHQEGDQYGLLTSADLCAFLQLFAAPGHRSFCLVTSRAPLLDLLPYTTYVERAVDRLSPDDGHALLRRLGVQGTDAALDTVVQAWDGHALTLTLLAMYLRDRWKGDVAHIGDIPAPTADEPRYERVQRVLRRYDEHLNDAERAFLTLFSAFRTPVDEAAFDRVFRVRTEPVEPETKPRFLDRLFRRKPTAPTSTTRSTDTLTTPLATLNDAAFNAMLQRLRDYRLVRYGEQTRHYTTHPLIRAHYLARLYGSPSVSAIQAAHARIKDHYLALAGDTPHFPTLDDLAPLIEVVYHACRAGAYDEAQQIRYERISQGNRHVLIHQLGAYETQLALLLEFFPNRDSMQESQVSAPNGKRHILAYVGFCLMSLGRLSEATPFYERSNLIALNMQDWENASITYRNLAELYAHLGALTNSGDAAREALTLARRAENKQDEMLSLVWQAWADHLRGQLAAAGTAFTEAEALQREDAPGTHYLYSIRGVQHADHLRRVDNADNARRVAEANLKICEEQHWVFLISLCHRVLGDLDADAGQHDSTRQHYDEALKLARSIQKRDVLIAALLARGRWAARRGDVAAARADLDEALGYAVASGYRIFEADIRIGLAWAHLAAGDRTTARQEAERSQQMSVEMDYHWGQVDAAEVLAALNNTE